MSPPPSPPPPVETRVVAPPGVQCGAALACITLEEALRYARHEAAGLVTHLHLLDGTYALGDAAATVGGRRALLSGASEGATFDASTAAHEIHIVGGGGAVLEAAASSMFTITAGGPHLVLSGVILTGSNKAPAIVMKGGSLELLEVTFESNPAGAIQIEGDATVEARECTFVSNGVSNGRPSLAEGGGAILALGGQMTMAACVLSDNVAADGGALLARGTASVAVSHSRFEGNHASKRGGAMAILESARVALANQTVLVANRAPSGSSIFRDGEFSRATYILPTPPGHWVADTIRCGDSTVAHAAECTPELAGAYLKLLPRGATDDYFPFRCAPGTYGPTADPLLQLGQQCAAPCPSGHSCGAATVVPLICPVGTHCVTGSSSPAVCSDGYYGDRPGLRGPEECLVCVPKSAPPSNHQA